MKRASGRYLTVLFLWLRISAACYVENSVRSARMHPTIVAEEVEGKENDEKRLLRYLMKGYERDVRPVRNASTPIVIQLSITLTQIFDMDEKNQVLTTIIWLDQEWEDELLTWDPSQFGGLKKLRMPCERIWLPDIVLYNNADDYTRGYMNSKAMVSHDGNVFWPPPTKLRSTCPVDVTYFPFDDQTCVLKLGSWTYDGFQVDVTNRTSEVDLTNYVPNGEWELLEARLIRNVVYYSCCPEPFPDLTVTLKIRRKTLYYMYNVVLPCMMMSVLTLLVFCLPPESGEKIALGVTVLLAFSVFMLAIAEKMPETSESIPLIGIYLTAVMAITSISVVMTVIVLNYHYKGPSSRQVPQWMRRYLLQRPRRSKKTASSSPSPPLESDTGCYRAYEPTSVETGSKVVRFLSNGSVVATVACNDGDDRPSEFLGRRGMVDPYRNAPVSAIPLASMAPTHPASSFCIRAPEFVPSAPVDASRQSSLKRSFGTVTSNQNQIRFPNEEAEDKATVHPSAQHQFLSMPCADTEGTPSRQPASRDGAGNACSQCQCIHYGLCNTSINNAIAASAASAARHQQQQQQQLDGVSDNEDLVLYFLERQRMTETGQIVVSEWRQVAAAVDRILFWVFCVITCVSSALFLLIIPGINRGWFTSSSAHASPF